MFKNNHKVTMIEYKNQIGLIQEDMVALFDKRDYSEEQIKKIIKLYDSYKGVIMISKRTYETVFRSLISK